MNKGFFVFSLFLFLVNVSLGQFAFIDSEYILSSVPEYAESKEKLDKLAETWTKDIEDRFVVIKTQKENFDKEEILLPRSFKSISISSSFKS